MLSLVSAAAPLIAFTDDDTVPDRDWLSEGLAAMARGAAAAIVVIPSLPALPLK
mgnify:CR=1 FL=1